MQYVEGVVVVCSMARVTCERSSVLRVLLSHAVWRGLRVRDVACCCMQHGTGEVWEMQRVEGVVVACSMARVTCERCSVLLRAAWHG